MPRPALSAALGVLSCLIAGCGGAAGEGTPATPPDGPLGEGGALVWAVAEPIGAIDPLGAESRAEMLASRQIHEPLTDRISGPFEPERRVAGLVRGAASSGDATIWTFQLRTGVRFQDGSPFNAAAVRANATRWLTTTAGVELVPDLVSVAAQKSDQVQFVLSKPDPDFPKLLTSPRLGIVSPLALSPSSGDGAILSRTSNTGTGPFELREKSASTELLARNTGWWGTEEPSLGPALQQVVFRSEPDPSIRLALLDAGEAQLADELGPEQAEQAQGDPLLTVLKGPESTFLGVSRSVRGVESAREIPSLSASWLTDVADPG